MQSLSRPTIEHSAAVAIEHDDYLVVGDVEPDRPGVGARIVHGLQILLILLMAALSFAIFWVVGLLLNIF
jgi:hypothetical protein